MPIDACHVRSETWPLLTPFRIARGAKTEAAVVTVELRQGPHIGRGESCPYARYGETIEHIIETVRAVDFASLGPTPAAMREALRHRLKPGSARNALDCALWDLEAKQSNRPVWQLASLPEPAPALTCFTLALDTPAAMAKNAARHAACPLLKLKLGDAPLDPDRISAVRDARPDARLVCDANEGWAPADLDRMLAVAAAHRLELIEQPLPAGADHALLGRQTTAPLCADESAAPGTAIAALAGRYQAVNIKLDKTGGLTHALAEIAEARRLGLKIMIGSMVSTSLAMAPASLLAGLADWVDLDSPLLLARDRPGAMTITAGRLSVATTALWG